MNKAIEDIARKAGAHFSVRNLMSNPVQRIESIELWDDRVNRFANLLIAECIAEVLPHWMMDQYGDRHLLEAVDRIRERFGLPNENPSTQ